MKDLRWNNVTQIIPYEYICGYCGFKVASNSGWTSQLPSGNRAPDFISVCSNCACPSYVDPGVKTIPGVAFGHKLEHLPDDVNEVYDEARNCMSINAFSSVVLLCRKLLMHIAVDKGAPEGKKFVEYVSFLSENNFVPAGSDVWVDQIRKEGNFATHEIVHGSRDQAELILEFSEMILKNMYEFPGKYNKRFAASEPD